MVLMIVLAFGLMLVGYYAVFDVSDQWARDDEAAILARQMIYYHAAAARHCASGCPAGNISESAVEAQLPTFRRNQGAFTDGRIRSYSTGSVVVTYYAPPGLGAYHQDLFGRIVSALGEEVPYDTGSYFGPYDAATGRILRPSPVLWRHPETGALLPAQPEIVAVQQAGIAVPDRAPVIANRI